jgi:hypothetical protein
VERDVLLVADDPAVVTGWRALERRLESGV